MQKTILISGTYPILDEKLNDLLGRSYDIAALEQPFPVNARKFGWVEAVVVYVPYCGEPEDAAAAQRYTEARAAADWATKEGLRCALLIDAEAHSFLPWSCMGLTAAAAQRAGSARRCGGAHGRG